MILNDVFDFKIDAEQRPERPLPSGRIERRTAAGVGTGLLALGVLLAGVVSLIAWQSAAPIPGLPLIVALALAGCILLYDGLLKSNPLGPVTMGLCRTLNILLGASVVGGNAIGSSFVLGFSVETWWIALAIGIYITGVTWLARNEASEKQNRLSLSLAAVVIILGLVGVATLPMFLGSAFPGENALISFFPLIAALIALPIIRRVLTAVAVMSPKTIQLAIIVCLRSVIVLDALLCFLVTPDQPLYASCVLILLIPSILLGRWIRAT